MPTVFLSHIFVFLLFNSYCHHCADDFWSSPICKRCPSNAMLVCRQKYFFKIIILGIIDNFSKCIAPQFSFSFLFSFLFFVVEWSKWFNYDTTYIICVRSYILDIYFFACCVHDLVSGFIFIVCYFWRAFFQLVTLAELLDAIQFHTYNLWELSPPALSRSHIQTAKLYFCSRLFRQMEVGLLWKWKKKMMDKNLKK